MTGLSNTSRTALDSGRVTCAVDRPAARRAGLVGAGHRRPPGAWKCRELCRRSWLSGAARWLTARPRRASARHAVPDARLAEIKVVVTIGNDPPWLCAGWTSTRASAWSCCVRRAGRSGGSRSRPTHSAVATTSGNAAARIFRGSPYYLRNDHPVGRVAVRV